MIQYKGIDCHNTRSYTNYIMTSNNINPVYDEKGNRRLIYYETNNSQCGNLKYYRSVFYPFQYIKEGPFTEFYMRLLLSYFIYDVDCEEFDGEEFIRKINSNTDLEYNEQLEHQYNSLSELDKYIVDNYKAFLRWNRLDIFAQFVNDNKTYKIKNILQKIRPYMTVERFRKKIEGRKCDIQIFKLNDDHTTCNDLWNIIKYKDSCNTHLYDPWSENIPQNATINISDDEDSDIDID